MAKKIGEREESLFVSIHDLVFVDVSYLEKYIFLKEDGTSSSKPYISKHMKILEKEGYVKSFPLAKEGDYGRNQLVYTLDTKGVQEVKEILGEAEWDARWSNRTPTYIYHSLRLSHLQAIYASIGGNPDITYYEYFSERRAYRNYGQPIIDTTGKERFPAQTVIRPDGAFIMKRTTKDRDYYLLYFVEMERSRQRAEVSMEKLKRYNAYCAKNTYKNDPTWGVEIAEVRVLFVSDKPTERKRLIQHTRSVNTKEINAVLYGVYEELLTNPYGDNWMAKDSKNPDTFFSLEKKIEIK
ncbi:replication-relaxation family protein [Peribacillus sp. NPDC096540]|uniref:replication-relaxation family protein n=1 Tax=Peribacillus sp. NPDC096540 TaxID=3390612 RepID=UPI003D0917A0